MFDNNNSTGIIKNSQASANISYFFKNFLVGFFPRKKTDAIKLKKDYGSFNIMLSSARNIPYGNMSRIMLHYICNEGMRSIDGYVSVGRSLSEFLRRLDFERCKHVVNSAIEQLSNIYYLSFFLSKKYENITTHGFTSCRFHLINAINLSWNIDVPKESLNLCLEKRGSIKLNDEFYKALKSKGAIFPLSWDVLRAIKNSCFALDFYAWWSYTAFASTFWYEPKAISWDNLMYQFSNKKESTSLEKRDFKRLFDNAITKVRSALSCPTKIDNMVFNTDHLLFKPTDPDVSPQVKLF